MPQVAMKLNEEEIEVLRGKALKADLSISDFLRKKSGFTPLRRKVGRPGFWVKCTKKGCGEMVLASAFMSHVRAHQR